MNTTGNTVLVTGGGSGIGRGLAAALHARGNRVIVAGRDPSKLEEVAEANPGIVACRLDVTDPRAVRRAAEELGAREPGLNVLVNGAGVMIADALDKPQSDLVIPETTVETNLLGPIRVTAAFLPQLMRQERSTIINVSSGLAFVSLVMTPTYCATKAGVHSWTVSLRAQLAGGPVEVLELVPPAVRTDLMPGHATNPRNMPLPQFIAEVMALLEQEPTPPKICVDWVRPLRQAEAQGRFERMLETLNATAES